MAELREPVFADVQRAQERISPHVHRTPVMTSRLLDEVCGATLFFKCEHLQKIGAFKARGATNALLCLDTDVAEAGVGTHSSGNHGAAVAMAAALRGIPAHIVMPSNSASVKKEAVRAYGGRVIECEPTQASRVETLAALAEAEGLHVVHPYNDPDVIAGQGTVALELLEQVSELDVLVAPVGGGGLLSGIALAAKHINPDIELLAVEPEGADDAFRSFGLGELQTNSNPTTIADGLRSNIGELNFRMIRNYVDTIITVPDSMIVRAMRLQWSRMKQVVEPSGAVSFAGLLEHPERFRGRRVGVIISGGNVDLDQLPW